tara:strand:- start:4665 stop:5264 length:600 start_codon:yes stop_codon:yes gene_type:complete
MELIAHRINKIKDLKNLPRKYGTEIDLRAKGSKIILNHNPFSSGDNFEDYLANYKHGTLVLNIKESGIESKTINLVKKFKVKKFFLLDVELPLICKNKKNDNKYFAIRYSEFETIHTAKKFINNVGWIWIDTFSKLPLNNKNLKLIKKFRSCLVCPERWGRPKDIKHYFTKLKYLNFLPNAVMTSKKYFKTWEKLTINY